MAKTSGYDWKITASKFLWILAEIIVAGVAVYFTDSNYCMALVPVLEALRNWIKHRND